MPIQFLLVALGGAFGSVLRFGIAQMIGRVAPSGFPLAILFINISGSFLMGILIGWGAQRGPLSQEMRALIGVGMLGGYTTFSTFSLDTVTLLQEGRMAQALLYIGASVLLGVAGLKLGLLAMRTLS